MFCRENQHRPKFFSARSTTMTSAMRKPPKRPRFHSLGKQAARPDGPLGLSYSETRLFIWRPPASPRKALVARSPAGDEPLTQALDDDGQELEHPLHLRRGRRRAEGQAQRGVGELRTAADRQEHVGGMLGAGVTGRAGRGIDVFALQLELDRLALHVAETEVGVGG